MAALSKALLGDHFFCCGGVLIDERSIEQNQNVGCLDNIFTRSESKQGNRQRVSNARIDADLARPIGRRFLSPSMSE